MNQINHYPKLTALALSFHVLDAAAGVLPFNADKLARWARSAAASDGAVCAAQFVLMVYNPRAAKRRRCGYFDVDQAMATWDAQNRAAFVEWARNPWWA